MKDVRIRVVGEVPVRTEEAVKERKNVKKRSKRRRGQALAVEAI